jgi:hypothetical protein
MRFVALVLLVSTIATLSFAQDRSPAARTVDSETTSETTPMAQDAGSGSGSGSGSKSKSKCTSGWIDACGGCFQPCDADKDCKVKGETCQPIVCAHTSYGNGCSP